MIPACTVGCIPRPRRRLRLTGPPSQTYPSLSQKLVNVVRRLIARAHYQHEEDEKNLRFQAVDTRTNGAWGKTNTHETQHLPEDNTYLGVSYQEMDRLPTFYWRCLVSPNIGLVAYVHFLTANAANKGIFLRQAGQSKLLSRGTCASKCLYWRFHI